MTTPTIAGARHAAPESPETFRDRLRDIVSPKTLVMGIGALVLQLAFILSYLGAFHAPAAHSIPVAIVAPGDVTTRVVNELNNVAGQPIKAFGATEADAREALRNDEISGVYLVDPNSHTDHLLVASGGGASVASAVQTVVTKAAQQQQRAVTVEDVAPFGPGDGRGMSGFYLVTGWAVGGYLFATMLSVAKGPRPVNVPRAVWRIASTVPYAVASGTGGALIAVKVLGAVSGQFWQVSAIGVLVTLASSTVAIALQTLFGTMGIGLTVLIFVVLGNPSAGGAYQAPLLPAFWRSLSDVLPNGAATDALRRVLYFGGHGAGHGLAVLSAWVIGGIVTALVGAAFIHRNNPNTVSAVFGGWRLEDRSVTGIA